MDAEVFYSFLPVIIGLSFVGLIVLAIAAIQDSRHGGQPTDIIRRVYVYLVTFITLLIVAVSIASLLDLGLRSSILTKADPTSGFFQEPPPALYFSTMPATGEPAKAPIATISCDSGCTLTEADRLDITRWEQSVKDWQNRQDISNMRARALVTPLSFLIIAGLVLGFHWRLVKRDRAPEGGNNLTRSTYFTAMSFIWLITLVAAGGMFLNTLLTSAIPGASKVTELRSAPFVDASGKQAVQKLVDCGETCALDVTTISTAQGWIVDNDAWEVRTQDNAESRSQQNSLAIELAFLIVAIPLFLYHFKIAWQSKKHTPPGIA